MKADVVYGEELDLLRAGKLGIPHEATDQVLTKTAKSLWFNTVPTLQKLRI